MKRKFWITVVPDEEIETRFRLSLLPYRYRKAPKTKLKMALVSRRTFSSEREVVREARALFGHIFRWEKDIRGRLQASLFLEATEPQ